MAVKYRLFYNGNLSIAGNKYTTVPGYDNTASVDNTHNIDNATTFDTTGEVTALFDYLFGITASAVTPDKIKLDEFGNLIAPAINESAELSGDIAQINSDNSISLAGIVTEGVTF